MNLNLTMLGQIIAFAFFVICCMKYVWPPLITAIEERQKKIAEDLIFAEDIKKKSNIIENKAKKCLQEAYIQAKDIINNANKLKMQILCDAEKQANIECTNILSKAKQEIQKERLRVYKEIRYQLSSLIADGVKKIIKSSINKQINDNIVDNLIKKLQI